MHTDDVRMTAIRVMMLSTDLQPGGYPLRLMRLALAVRERGVEPIVGSLAPRGPLHDELERAGIATFACDARGGHDATCLVRLARHVRTIDPDLIHAGLFHANVAARLVGRLDRPRPILTSTITIEIERQWHRWGEALTGGVSDLHFANAPSVAAHVRDDLGFAPDRVTLLPNGIDCAAVAGVEKARRETLGIPDAVPLLVWAGRMDPIKDLPTFVEVADRLNKLCGAHALLLGDGPERGRVEAMVVERKLTDAVHLAGWRKNVVEWLKAADVLVFPSLTEGCPNVLLEAMAAGCPVVAGDIAPCRDLIVNGRDGLLCPVGEAAEFAEAASSLVGDSNKRLFLSRNARSRVLVEHDLPLVVDQLVRVYRNVHLGRRGGL